MKTKTLFSVYCEYNLRHNIKWKKWVLNTMLSIYVFSKLEYFTQWSHHYVWKGWVSNTVCLNLWYLSHESKKTDVVDVFFKWSWLYKNALEKQMLETLRGGIDQVKWHHQVFVMLRYGAKGSFPLVSLFCILSML